MLQLLQPVCAATRVKRHKSHVTRHTHVVQRPGKPAAAPPLRAAAANAAAAAEEARPEDKNITCDMHITSSVAQHAT